MSAQIPEDVRHAKTHEWARVAGETATVGISDHAQRELTDVVFVELPKVGRQVKAGEACAVVESVKTASDVYSPLTGVVTEVNPDLVKRPELVNSSPYADGWFFKLKLDKPTEFHDLLAAVDYRSQIGE